MCSEPPELRERTRAEVADQLRALGVRKGDVLLVHTSFRAVRPVAGGPLGLIDALRDTLGRERTLVMRPGRGAATVTFGRESLEAAEPGAEGSSPAPG